MQHSTTKSRKNDAKLVVLVVRVQLLNFSNFYKIINTPFQGIITPKVLLHALRSDLNKVITPFDARRKMSLKDMKTTKWSITHWLTEGRTLESLQQLVQNMPNDWAIEGQIEQGKIDDKLHGQLFLKTPQTRGTRIAKFFPLPH